MSAPLIAGSSSIAKRWLSGSPTVLWIGDSIGYQFESHLPQVFPVTIAGLGVRGGNYTGLAAQAYHTSNVGGAINSGALPSGLKNYSITYSLESIFNGVAIGASGSPAGLANRSYSNGGEPLLLGTRTTATWAAADWMVGQANLSIRNIMYRDANGVGAGLFRNYARGSNSTSILKATGAFISTNGAAGYVTEDLALSAPAAAEDIYLESQAPIGGCAPTAATHFTLCYSKLTTGGTGFTFLPASVSGNSVVLANNTTYFSAAAWAGMLPLLGITDVVISLTQNGTPAASDFNTLVATIRAALPSASIVFIPTYLSYNDRADGGQHQTSTDACYASQQATGNSAFWNLFIAGGDPTQANALSFFTDGLHPSSAGKMFYLSKLWGLIQQHAATRPLTASRFPQVRL